MVEIIDYVDKYADAINNLDEEYWGICETDKASAEIKKGDIVKIALIGDTVVGLLHFKAIGNLIDCYHILVRDEYQHQGIATDLMQKALNDISKKNFITLIAHAVEHEGNVNARRLLENFGFSEIYSVKDYWNSLYSGEYCKQCDSYNCHCGVVVYIKDLKKKGTQIK